MAIFHQHMTGEVTHRSLPGVFAGQPSFRIRGALMRGIGAPLPRKVRGQTPHIVRRGR